MMRVKWDLGLRGGIAVTNPVPAEDEMTPDADLGAHRPGRRRVRRARHHRQGHHARSSSAGSSSSPTAAASRPTSRSCATTPASAPPSPRPTPPPDPTLHEAVREPCCCSRTGSNRLASHACGSRTTLCRMPSAHLRPPPPVSAAPPTCGELVGRSGVLRHPRPMTALHPQLAQDRARARRRRHAAARLSTARRSAGAASGGARTAPCTGSGPACSSRRSDGRPPRPARRGSCSRSGASSWASRLGRVAPRRAGAARPPAARRGPRRGRRRAPVRASKMRPGLHVHVAHSGAAVGRGRIGPCAWCPRPMPASSRRPRAGSRPGWSRWMPHCTGAW